MTEFTEIFNERVKSAQTCTRPKRGQADFVDHIGTLVTTESGKQYLIHSGPNYGEGDNRDKVLVDAKEMSKNWTMGEVQSVDATVGDMMQGKIDKYNPVTNSCWDTNKETMEAAGLKAPSMADNILKKQVERTIEHIKNDTDFELRSNPLIQDRHLKLLDKPTSGSGTQISTDLAPDVVSGSSFSPGTSSFRNRSSGLLLSNPNDSGMGIAGNGSRFSLSSNPTGGGMDFTGPSSVGFASTGRSGTNFPSSGGGFPSSGGGVSSSVGGFPSSGGGFHSSRGGFYSSGGGFPS